MTKTPIEQLKAQEAALSFQEEMAKDEWEHRKRISDTVMSAFKAVNFTILGIIVLFFIVESALIFYGKQIAGTRIIDSKAVMALIAATTVQLGAISFSISKWLFGTTKGGRSPS